MVNKSLLKGTLSTLVLKQLADNGQMYGYEIIQKIKAATAHQLKVTEGALYPSLHKLEEQGLLTVERREVSGRTRKYYALSAKGKKASQEQQQQLQAFLNSVQTLLQPKTN